MGGGGTCAIIQTKCCIFIPDKSANISSLLAHMKTQVKALSNLAPSLGDQPTHWFGSGGEEGWKKLLLILGLLLLMFFSCMYMYCCSEVCLQCGHLVTKQATSLLLKPLADHSGHLAEEGTCEAVRASHQWWSLEERLFYDETAVCPTSWIQARGRWLSENPLID